MLIRQFIFVITILLPTGSYCCTCPDIEKKDAKKIIDSYEYAILGTVVETINSDENEKAYFDSIGSGFEVKLRIDSILAGQTDLNYIVVVQFTRSNCTRGFKIGEQYVILGDQVKEFINKTPEYEEIGGQIPITVIPPPSPGPGGIVKGRLNCYNMEAEEISYWNDLVQEETIISTGLCSSFYAKSRYGSYFLL